MNIFDIRYVKLHFSVRILEGTHMPKHKVSALRGGIGEMLLQMNCIADRNCEACGFEEECIVRRIMYAKGNITPKTAGEGESQGYVLECWDLKEEYMVGENLRFNLLLFGKNIVYFNQYLQAVTMLGQCGLGKNESKFEVVEVKGTHGEPILYENMIDYSNYKLATVQEYVNMRTHEINNHFEQTILLQSPLSLKKDGKILTDFDLEAIYKAAARRLYMLCCFEGIEWDDSIGQEIIPYEVEQATIFHETVPRYSNHKQQKMILNGIQGKIELKKVEEEDELFKRILLAGELLHVGRNRSFGFGKYILK